jgi:hypothetical protein
MRTGISITRSVRGRLEAITRDRNASQKHAWRAAIILSSADGVGTNEIMRRIAETNAPKPFTWTADPDKIIAAVRAPSVRFHPLDGACSVG